MDNFDRREPLSRSYSVKVPFKLYDGPLCDCLIGTEALINKNIQGDIPGSSALQRLQRGWKVKIVSRDTEKARHFIVSPASTYMVAPYVVVSYDDLDFPFDAPEPVNFGGMHQKEVTVQFLDHFGLTTEEQARRLARRVHENACKPAPWLPASPDEDSQASLVQILIEDLLQIGEVKFSPMPDGKVFTSFFPKDCGGLWLYRVGTMRGSLEGILEEARRLKIFPPLEQR